MALFANGLKGYKTDKEMIKERFSNNAIVRSGMYQQTERSQSLIVIHDPIMPRFHTSPRMALSIITSLGRLCRDILRKTGPPRFRRMPDSHPSQ